MAAFTKRVYILACLAAFVYGAPPRELAFRAADTADSPGGSSTTPIPHSPNETVRPASNDPNYPIYPPDVPGPAQPVRGNLGAVILGPQNVPVQEQNPDVLAPPTTDHGDVPNAKWPFALSSNHIYTGGWARQQNVNVMSIATSMAGVNMRLKPGAVRELHWHKTAEWAYVIKGSAEITAVDENGRNYVAIVNTGDTWYFPPGIPHSLQATADIPEGSEFLLVFPDGDFSEVTTFQITDWLAHVPKEVIAKNFQMDITNFDHIPSQELYIFPLDLPIGDVAPSDPQGQVPNPFSFPLSKVDATRLNGGTVKILDSTTFKISTKIAMAEVTVEPGALRELHWHPTQDEWLYVIKGDARMTLFASSSNARTFDYQGGDIGYVPASFGHYVENIGNETLHYLEIFNTDRYQDISLSQWLALTPPALVKAHLGLSDEAIAQLSKTKQIVVGPSKSEKDSA